MNDQKARTCPECSCTVHEIKIVDKGGGNASLPLEYAAVDAQPGFWNSKVTMAGDVKAFMCQGCGLIKLYGVPKSW